MNAAAWAAEIFARVDAKDTAGFLAFLTGDASFRFASHPPAVGREAIGTAVGGFFAGIGASRHRILNAWITPGHVVVQGEVTYTRHDGSALALPFANILRMRAELIDDYRIYIDASSL